MILLVVKKSKKFIAHRSGLNYLCNLIILIIKKVWPNTEHLVD